MVRTVFGARYFFCGEMCRDGYKSDRMCGLIYGPYRIDGKSVTGSEFSLSSPRACIYCGAPEKRRTVAEVQA